MIKKNIAKAMILGLCMAAFSTGSAYAMMAETPASVGASSGQSEALNQKQQEIDAILFKDKANEIEKQGFMVNYTGVAEDVVEIGISPYSEENAAFVYELVGKDEVKVVEMDQSVIYATGVAPDEAVSDDEMDAEVVMYNDAAEDTEEELKIQIESTSGAEGENTGEEKVYKTTAQVGADGEKTVAAQDQAAKQDGILVPVMIITAVILIGGTSFIVINKKKAVRK